jgi:hypothetical protein
MYTIPGTDGFPRCIYRVYDFRTGEEVELASWEELKAYLERCRSRRWR